MLIIIVIMVKDILIIVILMIIRSRFFIPGFGFWNNPWGGGWSGPEVFRFSAKYEI